MQVRCGSVFAWDIYGNIKEYEAGWKKTREELAEWQRATERREQDRQAHEREGARRAEERERITDRIVNHALNAADDVVDLAEMVLTSGLVI